MVDLSKSYPIINESDFEIRKTMQWLDAEDEERIAAAPEEASLEQISPVMLALEGPGVRTREREQIDEEFRIPRTYKEVSKSLEDHSSYLTRGALEQIGSFSSWIQDQFNGYRSATHNLQARAMSAALGVVSPTTAVTSEAYDEMELPVDFRMEILGKIGEEAKELGMNLAPKEPKQLSHKLAYYTGYLAPELVALGKITGGARLVGNAMGFFSEWLAGLLGASAYGLYTGGVEKARDFAVLDILSTPFGRYSKPVRAVAMSGLMAGYSTVTNDPNSKSYDPDAPLIGAIMGFGFGLLGPSGKRSWNQDVKNTAQTVRAWVVKERQIGHEPRPSAYVDDVLLLKQDLTIRALNSDYRVLDPVGEVQQWVRGITGKPTEAVGPELQAQIRNALMKSPGSEPVSQTKAEEIASRMMQTVQMIKQGNAEHFRGLELDQIRTKPVEDVIELKPVVVDGQRIFRTAEGIKDLQVLEAKRIVRERIEDKIRAREGKIVATGMSNTAAIISREKSPKTIISDIRRLTVAPEGTWLKEIKKFPEFYTRVKDLYNRQYNSTDLAGIYIDEAWDAIGYSKYDEKYQDYQRRYISARRDVDLYRRKSRKFMEKDWMSPKDAQTEIEVIEDMIRTEKGEAALLEFQEHSDAYFEHEQLALRRLKDSGVVSAEVYDSIHNNHYATSMDVAKLESDQILSEFGVYDTSVKGTTPVRALLKPHGGFRSEDVMYLLNRSMFITEAAIVKNQFYHGLEELAKAHPVNPISAIIPRPAFQRRPDGSWEEIAYEDALKIDRKRKELQRERWEARKAKRAEEALHPKDVQVFDETGQYSDTELVSTELKKALTEKRQKVKTLEKLKRKTDKLFKDLEKSEKEREVDIKIRPNRDDFARDKERLGETIYDINELQDHIDVENDIIESLLWEKDKHGRIRFEDPVAPAGWELIEYQWQSEPRYIAVPADIRPLMRIKGEGGKTIREARTRFWLGVATGVPVIKAASVALNPLFGIKSLPRDINYFGMTDSEVVSLTHYNGKSAVRILSHLKDALSQSGFYTEYRKAGGFAGESGTMAGLAMESIGGRSFKTRVNDYRAKDPVIREQYQKGVRALGYLSAMSEVAVRMNHTEYLVKHRGFDVKKAVERTNSLLNFKRKGPMMETIDQFYAFAGARGQVLSGFWNALMGDVRKFKYLKSKGEIPEQIELIQKTEKGKFEIREETKGFFVTKMLEYALARAAVIGLAYAAYDKYMSELNVDFKINNWIIPIPGLTVEDENGQEIQGSFRVVNEVNPLTALTDSLIYRGFDRLYGYDTPERAAEYYQAWSKALSPADVGSLPPNIKAYIALFYNHDPSNYEAIWRDWKTGLPEDWSYRNTNQLANTLAPILQAIPYAPGTEISPAGLATAANQYGLANNITTGFLGSLFATERFETNKSTARTIYEYGKPFFKTALHWERTGATADRIKRIAQEASSPGLVNLRKITEDYAIRVQDGRMSYDDAIEAIEQRPIEDADVFDRVAAQRMFVRKIKGWELWKEARELYPDEIKKLPYLKDLKLASTLPDKQRLAVYDYFIQSLDEKARIAFDYIAPGFGFKTSSFMGRAELKKEMEKAKKRELKP